MAETCCVDGCSNPIKNKTKKLCNAHRLRLERRGTLDAARQKYATEEERAEAVKGWKRTNYERNKDRYKEAFRRWVENNPDKYRERIAEYLSREDIQKRARARSKEWRVANPERKREADRKFTSENRGLVTSYKAAREARVLRATPPWLTDEHWRQIRDVYDLAARMAIQTGIPHDVDHYIPIRGKTVSGLHVPWNLRVLPRDENNRRPRIWDPDNPPEF